MMDGVWAGMAWQVKHDRGLQVQCWLALAAAEWPVSAEA